LFAPKIQANNKQRELKRQIRDKGRLLRINEEGASFLFEL